LIHSIVIVLYSVHCVQFFNNYKPMTHSITVGMEYILLRGRIVHHWFFNEGISFTVFFTVHDCDSFYHSAGILLQQQKCD
jgi:hypothetical protein